MPSPLSGVSANSRYNFDGIVTTGLDKLSYIQTFRNGIIEVVDLYILGSLDRNKRPCIPSIDYEKKIISKLSEYILIQQKLGSEPPFMIILSLLNVKGYSMLLPQMSMYFPGYDQKIDRDNLIVPGVMVESFDFEPSKVMKPIFDTVWNACGYPGSRNYDDSGNWAR